MIENTMRHRASVRSFLITASLAAALASGCAQDGAAVQSSFARSGVAPLGQTDRVAILDFEGAGGPAFADLLAQEFMKNKVNAVERSALRAVVDEREIAARTPAELDVNTLRSDIGNAMFARVVLIGSMVEHTDSLTPVSGGASGRNALLVTCRAIDPKNGRLLWIGAVKTGAEIVSGESAGPLTAWRLAAQEIVRAYKESGYPGQSVAFEAAAIPK